MTKLKFILPVVIAFTVIYILFKSKKKGSNSSYTGSKDYGLCASRVDEFGLGICSGKKHKKGNVVGLLGVVTGQNRYDTTPMGSGVMHSEIPNTKIMLNDLPNRRVGVFAVALRDINPKEELTIDYSNENYPKPSHLLLSEMAGMI